MCLAMEKYTLDTKIEGVIEYLRDEGKNESEIISVIMKRFAVDEAYVKELMAPVAV